MESVCGIKSAEFVVDMSIVFNTQSLEMQESTWSGRGRPFDAYSINYHLTKGDHDSHLSLLHFDCACIGVGTRMIMSEGEC